MRHGNPHQTGAIAPVARTRPWLAVSAAALCWGMFTILVMHVANARNPVLDTLSSYAITDRGAGMLTTSILSVAVGSLAVLGALNAARVPIGATTRILFGIWAGGLMLAAAFPASYAELPDPVSGEIHQYSCLIAFLSLPGIGFSLLDRVRAIPALARSRATVARWTRYSVATLVLFGISYLLAKYPDTPVVAELGTLLPVGVTQRIALIVDVGLLCSVLALAARAASGRSREAAVTA
jgi:hypothetical protein